MATPAEYDRYRNEFRDHLDAEPNMPTSAIRAYWEKRPEGVREPLDILLDLLDTHMWVTTRAGRRVRMRDYAIALPELDDAALQKLYAMRDECEKDEDLPAPEADLAFPRIPGCECYNELGDGNGKTARVFRVWNFERARQEAVKVPRHEVLDAVWPLWQKERDALGRIHHDHICRIVGFGTDAEIFNDKAWVPAPYIRMEYIRGSTLDVWVKQERVRLPERKPVELARLLARKLVPIAEALGAAHKVQSVHRDVKPANILIDHAGKSWLVDFGFVGSALSDGAPPVVAGGLVGTLAVMPPEQIPASYVRGHRGDPNKSDERMDVYSLGATFYWLAFDHPPFIGNESGPRELQPLLERIVREPLTFPANAPADPDLRAICRKAMEKKPDERYSSPGDHTSVLFLADDLRWFSEGRPAYNVRPPGPIRKVILYLRKHRLLLLATAVTAALLVLAGFYARGWWHERRHQQLVEDVRTGLQPTALTDEQKDVVEADLTKLDEFRRARGKAPDDGEWMEYVRKLLSQPALSPRDLERLEGALDRLTPDRLTSDRIHELRLTESLDQLTKPFTRTTSVYAFIRHDPHRLANLERIVRLEGRIAPERVGGKQELIKAYAATGNELRAWELAHALLARPDLPPAWRVCLLRDYVWLAIRLGNPERLKAAREQVTKYDPNETYIELLVEDARLDAAANNFAEALRKLTVYFERAAQLDVWRKFNEIPGSDPRYAGVGLSENVPAVSFLDAALLQGVLLAHASPSDKGPPESAKKAWARGFETVRNLDSGTSYEAAMLAALSGLLTEKDTFRMITQTNKDTKKIGSSTAMDNVEKIIGLLEKFITGVLQRAWTEPPGYDYAARIALRKIGFGEYTTIQIRLWLYQGLRVFAGGDAGTTKLRDVMIWQMIDDLYLDFATGTVTEEDLGAVAKFAATDGEKQPERWEEHARLLPVKVRGPMAFILARMCLRGGPKFILLGADALFRPGPETCRAARAYLEYARDDATRTHPNAALKELAEAELKRIPR